MHKITGTILAAFFMALLFVACKPTQQQAVAYSDRIINQQKAIDAKERELITSLDTDTNAVEPAYKSYMQQVTASIDTVRNLDEFGSNTDFRDAAEKLFNTYKEVGEREYREIVSIMKKSDDRLTDDDKQRVKDLLNKISIRLNTEVAALNQAQEAFAKEHRIQIEEKELKK